jgi:hypothetical protein
MGKCRQGLQLGHAIQVRRQGAAVAARQRGIEAPRSMAARQLHKSQNSLCSDAGKRRKHSCIRLRVWKDVFQWLISCMSLK